MAAPRERQFSPWVWKVGIAITSAMFVLAVVFIVRGYAIDGALFAALSALLLAKAIRGLRLATTGASE